MSRLMITSDLHLGHANAIRWRPQFSSPEEHDQVIFDNLASSITKRDSLFILGDCAFTEEWFEKVGSILCAKKTLILGNHDTDRNISIKSIVDHFDEVHSLMSKRNLWFSHAPIHPEEMRRRYANIHGHTHGHCLEDERYINVCLEQTDYKPISFHELQERYTVLQNYN